MTVHTKTPMIIEGVPVSVSIRNRRKVPNLFDPNSDRKMPARIPIGIPISEPAPMSMTEPTISAAISLSGSPIGLNEFVRKLRLSARIPSKRMYPRITNSEPTAKAAHSAVSAVIVLLSSLRRDRLDMRASPSAPGYAPHNQTSQHIDHEGDQK